MYNLLITGAGGFIGNHLISLLLGQHKIFGLVRKVSKNEVLTNGVEWIEDDLEKPFEFIQMPKKIDIIIHLAQSRQYRKFPEESLNIFKVNIASTLYLLEYGRKIGIKKFIYASSGGIYGYSYEKFIETDIINPINFYLTSKYCSELLIGNYNHYFNTVVFRFFFVYGPNQRGMLIPRIIDNIRKGEPIIIYGKTGIKLNPIHVRDAINAFPPALETPVSGVFNIAGDEIISIKDLSEKIGKLLGKEPIFAYEKSPILGDIIGDNSRMKSMLGVIPKISLDEGLSEVVKCYGFK